MNRADIFTHGGNLYAMQRQKGGKMEELLDFSANINPLGFPDSARLAVAEALPYIIHYPDAEAAVLKEAIGRRFGMNTEQISLGNGAAELLYVLCHMTRPQRVLIPAPTFSEYERAARASGAAVEYLYLDPATDFAIPVEEVVSHLAEVDILFLCNPNNPTGRIMPRCEVEKIIAAAASKNVRVVLDESFLEFLPDEANYSCRSLLASYANLVIVQSLTKFYALPGLRLGFVLADKTTCELLDKGKDPWNVNSLAQAAGAAALADDGYRAASLAIVSSAREAFCAALREIPGFRPLSATANFLLVSIAGSGYSASQLRQALLAVGVLIRDCSNYVGLSDDYIRLAVKLPQQNEQLLTCLRKLIEGRDRA
ncbi:MAG: threonine-phosphate decarboxylase CobD [Negativicutes bacterium]|nr:threonine-phosphate decarboxylase CobD [Negativicutes bacterium]